MRELLVIIGVVLIALILWDGLRRMRRKGRYSDDYQDPDEVRKKAELARELPNGGARIRPMDNRDKTDLNTRLNLRERVPMLMDPVDEEVSDTDSEPAAHLDQHSLDFDTPVAELSSSEAFRYAAKTTAVDNTAADERHEEIADHDLGRRHSDAHQIDDQAAIEEPVEAIDNSDDGNEFDPPNQSFDTDWDDIDPAEPVAADNNEQADDRPVEELVIIHVMAPDSGQLAGSELLELLLRAGLRFGPMDIFHYRNSKGQLEFSLANCVQPGTLDPDGMAEMTTPGVTLFMQLPQRADLLTSFDHMVEMGQFLAQHLNAEMLDENHSTVTPQRVEHYRERLRNFARTQLIQAHE